MISTARSYLAYGLKIHCNRPVPGLVACFAELEQPDLRIFLHPHAKFETRGASDGETPWYVGTDTDANGEPVLKIFKGNNRGDFSIRYANGPTFHIDSGFSCIRICDDKLSDAVLALYLLGPVMGILLRLKGFTCLHASAVNFRGKALVFAGDEASGKSTTAAVFARHGHAVMTDDIAVLDAANGKFRIRSGYPALNLLPESVKLVCGSENALPPADPTVEKLQMGLDAGSLRFQKEPLEAGVILVMNEAPESVPISVLRPADALMALASNTYANTMLDAEMRASEFRALGTLVRAVPVLRLIRRRGDLDTERFYEAICNAAEEAAMLRPVREIA